MEEVDIQIADIKDHKEPVFSLKLLDPNYQLTVEDMDRIIETVNNNTFIESLAIENCGLRDKHIACLVKLEQKKEKKLKYLSLEDNGIGEKGLLSLIKETSIPKINFQRNNYQGNIGCLSKDRIIFGINNCSTLDAKNLLLGSFSFLNDKKFAQSDEGSRENEGPVQKVKEFKLAKNEFLLESKVNKECKIF